MLVYYKSSQYLCPWASAICTFQSACRSKAYSLCWRWNRYSTWGHNGKI